MKNKSSFEKIYKKWWLINGPCKALHALNTSRVDFIINKTNNKKKKIIDIGCGGGILSESLQKLGANVTWIDISKKLIKTAKNHAKKQNLNIKYINIDINDFFKKNKKKFDIILCMELIEHINNPEKLINSCNKMIKKKGKIFISSINKIIKSYIYIILIGEFISKIIPKGTHNYNKFISPYNLNKILNKNGLNIKEIKGIKYNPIFNYSFITDNISTNYITYIKKIC